MGSASMFDKILVWAPHPAVYQQEDASYTELNRSC